jgi:hypothetical protein
MQEFNARVMSLRETKEKIIAWIQKAYQRIAQINELLGITEVHPIPTLQVFNALFYEANERVCAA